MQKYLKSHILWSVAALIIIDGVFFGATNPAQVSSAVLFVGFCLASLTIFALVRALRVVVVRRLHVGASYARAESYIAGVMIVSLALSSLGQLSVRDFTLLVVAAIAVYWYVSYQKHAPS